MCIFVSPINAHITEFPGNPFVFASKYLVERVAKTAVSLKQRGSYRKRVNEIVRDLVSERITLLTFVLGQQCVRNVVPILRILDFELATKPCQVLLLILLTIPPARWSCRELPRK